MSTTESPSSLCNPSVQINMATTSSCTLLSKMDYIYEVEVLPSQQQMCTTPLQNDYSAIAKKVCNPRMMIHSMVQQKMQGVKEYVSATPLVQHPILVRKGRPVVVHLSLLNTRFNKYQHANLSTSEMILDDDGTVFVTMFSDINIPLADPHLMKALKIQV
ncbi:hypothetical protein FXO38_06185 [Capsicum annuum]|nr:hypothetical protein FXO38_06185 [Capsicum annuum]